MIVITKLTILSSLAFLSFIACTKARLIFVTTSYVPEGEVGRFVKDAIIYNDIAKDIMKSHKVQINDIYEESKEIHTLHATAPDNVHYTEEGYRVLAQAVIRAWKNYKLRY